MTERLKKDIIKLVIDEVVIEGESVKIFATIPLPNKIHEREMDKTDIPGTFNAGATLGPVNETNMTRIWNKHKQTNTPLKRKVFVAMSGGVDSSVAAALLLRDGYNVVGGFIKTWSDAKDVWTGECAWRGERRDAMRVAAKLGIPLLTFDFEEAYQARVVDDMFRGYAAGETPNPDVRCNEFIKFGLFFDEAMRLGFDGIATGHYARAQHDETGIAHLLRGRDADKDQSYFLYRVPQQALRRTLFPIGHLQKSEVRATAREFKLSVAEKPDSQGICFIGKLHFADFLRAKISSRPGEIVDERGNVLGRHEGLDGYTVGQRKRIAMQSKVKSQKSKVAQMAAWYVAEKDATTNRLVVVQGADHPRLFRREAIVQDLHWIRNAPPGEKFDCDVVIRYRQEAVRAHLSHLAEDRWQIEFQNPIKAIAPGQSAVFYNGGECLGGGVIFGKHPAD